MPHKDTRIAIKQAISQALNATQGHKPSFLSNKLYYSGSKCHRDTCLAFYQTSYITQALNATGTQA